MNYSEIIADLQAKAVDMEDHELAALLAPYRMRSRILVGFFDDAESLFECSPNPLLSKLAKRSAKFRDRLNGRNAVKEHFEKNGYGALVQDREGTKWAYLHPSVDSVPRVSFFDRNGFYAHSDCNSIDECAEEAFQYGMRTIAPSDIMDKVFKELAA